VCKESGSAAPLDIAIPIVIPIAVSSRATRGG
jgi:hypothetical protein